MLTTTHGLGYAKIVIVVDADVDPFDLKQVMWAMSVKVNPAGDIVTIPNLAENLLDPACSPGGIVTKMIIDATTPVAPDVRGDYGEELDTPQGTDQWRTKLTALGQGDAEMTASTANIIPPHARDVDRAQSGCSANLPLSGSGLSSVVRHASMPGDQPSRRRT